MLSIIGYELTVRRGARAGLVKRYGPEQRAKARSFADRLDQDYGAICAHVKPLFGHEAPRGWAVAETSVEG